MYWQTDRQSHNRFEEQGHPNPKVFPFVEGAGTSGTSSARVVWFSFHRRATFVEQEVLIFDYSIGKTSTAQVTRFEIPVSILENRIMNGTRRSPVSTLVQSNIKISLPFVPDLFRPITDSGRQPDSQITDSGPLAH